MEQIKAEDYVVFDGKNKILGRLASVVAKHLLNGKLVAVINAEQIIISGDERSTVQKYKTRLTLVEKANPEHSPYWSRRPDMLVKRVIRGMVPYRSPHGKTAYRLLRVFIGVPEEFKKVNPIEIEAKPPKTIYSGYITIGELSKALGYNK